MINIIKIKRAILSVSDKTGVGSRRNHSTDSAAEPSCASLYIRQAGPVVGSHGQRSFPRYGPFLTCLTRRGYLGLPLADKLLVAR